MSSSSLLRKSHIARVLLQDLQVPQPANTIHFLLQPQTSKTDGKVCVIGQLFLMQPNLSFSSISEEVGPALLSRELISGRNGYKKER
jgi:hypothetical protein